MQNLAAYMLFAIICGSLAGITAAFGTWFARGARGLVVYIICGAIGGFVLGFGFETIRPSLSEFSLYYLVPLGAIAGVIAARLGIDS